MVAEMAIVSYVGELVLAGTGLRARHGHYAGCARYGSQEGKPGLVENGRRQGVGR